MIHYLPGMARKWSIGERTRVRPVVLATALGLASACWGASPSLTVLDGIRAEIGRISEALGKRPDDARALTALAEAYLREAQVSGDGTGYGRAEAALRKVLALDPRDYGALALQGWVEYGQHRFREAEASARKAIAIAPDAGRNYALLSDALLELGRYDAAVDALQLMLDRQPGPAGYSRAAHMRFLHGDLDGALEMVETGLESSLSGGARDVAAWLYTQAGEIHAARGDATKARRSFEQALGQVPGYFRAVGPLARLLANQGESDHALELLKPAIACFQEPGLLGTLEDIAEARRDAAAARAAAEMLEVAAKLDLATTGRLNRTHAVLDLERQRAVERAVTAAEAEYRERPDIYSADALAWARFRTGKLQPAAKLSAEACRLGTPDALLLYHRGAILERQGKTAEGAAFLAEALRRGATLPPGVRAKEGLGAGSRR
ncbi:MAG: tetratricopeptide repeat protein [Candidatus Wallbacteria bacterium]|nr:tetratricopeptide repeat protein [Candidatus Wallbacteria bacterium]